MNVAAEATGGPQWVQVLLSVLGVLGGASGLGVITTVVTQRRKFKADAADTLTDAALTLVQPLRTRITELESEAMTVRLQVDTSRQQLQELRATVWELRNTLDRWREAILAPEATLRRIRAVVLESDRRSIGR